MTYTKLTALLEHLNLMQTKIKRIKEANLILLHIYFVISIKCTPHTSNYMYYCSYSTTRTNIRMHTCYILISFNSDR